MNDMSEAPKKLWARKGEVVTCVRSNHPICSLSRDVYVGDRKFDIFTDWQQPEPQKGDSVHKIRCVHCRSVWIRGSRAGGYSLHFADGWR